MRNVLNAFWVIACGAGLIAASQAQSTSATNMDILRQKLRADKKLLVAANLALTEAEGKAFWPVYDAFQTELTSLNQRTARLVGNYAKAYNAGPITDATAQSLTAEVMAIDKAELDVRQSFLPKLQATLPATKLARYLQIENKIRALIRYELAANIPFVE